MADRKGTRWWILLGCLVCQMGLGLGGYVFAVFLKPVVTDLGWSRAGFAGAGGPLLLGMACASPLVGTLTDRAGPRVVFTAAITLVAAVLLGLSAMDAVWQLYALGILLGVGITGLGDIPVGAVVARWFGRQRGLALGLVYVGSNIGGALVPLVAVAVAEGSSWRTALRVLAVGGWLLIVPFALLAVRDAPTGVEDDATLTAEQAAPALTLDQARRTASFWLLGFVLFAFYFYYLGVNNHLVAFLSDAGFSDAAAAARFSFAVGIGIAGKIGMGFLADRVPIRRVTMLTFGALTLASLALLAIGWVPGLLPWFLAVHGFTVAAENVMLPLLVAHCFGVTHMAQIYGALMFVLLPGGALGATFAGWVFDRTASYWPAFALFAALNVVGLVALACVRPAVPRRAAVVRPRSSPGRAAGA
jgi:MFS family permease